MNGETPMRRRDILAAMLADAGLCERVRRLRVQERRSYDFIAGREDVSADHLRLLGAALGLPSGHLNRARLSCLRARREAGAGAGAAP